MTGSRIRAGAAARRSQRRSGPDSTLGASDKVSRAERVLGSAPNKDLANTKERESLDVPSRRERDAEAVLSSGKPQSCRMLAWLPRAGRRDLPPDWPVPRKPRAPRSSCGSRSGRGNRIRGFPETGSNPVYAQDIGMAFKQSAVSDPTRRQARVRAAGVRFSGTST